MPPTSTPCSASETALCRVSIGRYMRLVAEDWLASRGWLLLVGAAAIWLLLGGNNPRSWMALLMFAALIAPALIGIIFYSYGLTPEAAAAIRPHRVEVHPDGAISLIFPPDPDSGRQIPPLRFPTSALGRREQRGNETIIHLNGKPFRYIIIPSQNV